MRKLVSCEKHDKISLGDKNELNWLLRKDSIGGPRSDSPGVDGEKSERRGNASVENGHGEAEIGYYLVDRPFGLLNNPI